MESEVKKVYKKWDIRDQWRQSKNNHNAKGDIVEHRVDFFSSEMKSYASPVHTPLTTIPLFAPEEAPRQFFRYKHWTVITTECLK